VKHLKYLFEAKKAKSENFEVIREVFTDISDNFKINIDERRKNEFRITIDLEFSLDFDSTISSRSGIDKMVSKITKVSDLYISIKEALDRLSDAPLVYTIKFGSEMEMDGDFEMDDIDFIVIDLHYNLITKGSGFFVSKGNLIIVNEEILKKAVLDSLGISVEISKEDYSEDYQSICVDFSQEVFNWNEDQVEKFENIFKKYIDKYELDFNYQYSDTGILVIFGGDFENLIIRDI
jgi:HEPN domain-containing protein